MKTLPILFTFIALALIGFTCNSTSGTMTDSLYMDYDHQVVPYKLYDDQDEFTLNNELKEISGLSRDGRGALAAVEDESGTLYILDRENGDIIKKIRFSKGGDYEGVEVVDGKAYVVKSNGDIFSFKISGMKEATAEITKTVLSSKNDVEGLGYDGDHLLIACKEEGAVEENRVKGKGLYQYDIEKEALLAKSVFSIDLNDLRDHVKENRFFNKIDDFKPSAVAVHPQSGDIYVLSAKCILAIFSSSHEIRAVVRLDNSQYRQPEGICFTPDGTMFIASEGDGGKGKIFKLSLMN